MITKQFESLYPAIEAYPAEKMRPVHMPVDEFLQECRELHQWALEDEADLVGVGMPGDTLADLKLRIEALAEWEGKWNRDRSAMLAAQKLWAQKMPIAVHLRKKLIHSFGFALRAENYGKEREAIDRIKMGRGTADLIQDLRELAILGESITDELQAIRFDLSEIDNARSLHTELSEIAARANGEEKKSNKIKSMRDRAYCYLRDAADNVIDYGKYVFWENANRLKGYGSIY